MTPIMSRAREAATLVSVCLTLWLTALPAEAAPAAPPPPPPSGPHHPGPRPPADPGVHVVRAGETLLGIARLYGVELVRLVELNQIANPNLIFVGQRLLIPAPEAAGASAAQPAAAEDPPAQSGPGSLYTVRAGDTLFAIAARHGSTVAALVTANRLADPNLIRVGQTLRVPAAASADPRVSLTTTLPAQGSTVIVRIEGAAQASGQLGDRPLSFAPHQSGLVALAGFAPWDPAGPRSLTVTYTTAEGEARSFSQPLHLQPTRFQIERWSSTGSGLPVIPRETIIAERERVLAVYAGFRPQRLWSGSFSYPLQSYRLTSDYGTARAFDGAAPSWWHEGLDLAAPTGTPVYAPAGGIVALAEELVARGGAVILDHGWGVFSGYWHLSDIHVQPGQQVEKGTLLGRVGSTGLSTGPHLHWEIRVQQQPVDPRPWLQGLP